MADLADLTELAREYLVLADTAEPAVRIAAEAVIGGFNAIASAEQADITDLLTGNPRADLARLETAAAAGVINAAINWAAMPAEAFRLAKMGVSLALLFA